MSDPPNYIMASREGLYFVNRNCWRRVAEGYFFGVTVRGSEIYCFKTVAKTDAKVNSHSGQIVRYGWNDDRPLIGPEILVEGLHHNCHQVDFFDGKFYIVDTRHQRILVYNEQWQLTETHQILPEADERGPDDAHINSIYGQGDSIYVMLHNNFRKRPSEIVEYDRQFCLRRSVVLPSSACHDIVRLEDGTFLFCESFAGRIARSDGLSYQIDELFTRGLAVGEDELAVGSSLFGRRLARALLPGFVTFLDRSYQRTGRVYVPAAPTQIRRLDGADLSLSRPR